MSIQPEPPLCRLLTTTSTASTPAASSFPRRHRTCNERVKWCHDLRANWFIVTETLRIHQPHSLHSISVFRGKARPIRLTLTMAQELPGVMLHATGDRLMDSDSGVYLRVYSRSHSNEWVQPQGSGGFKSLFHFTELPPKLHEPHLPKAAEF